VVFVFITGESSASLHLLPQLGLAEHPLTDECIVRDARLDDAATVADLHVVLISEGFLSFLGPRFLSRLYRRIIVSSDSFLLVAEAEGRIVGFIAGSTDVRGLYRSFLWHDGVRAATLAAGRLISSPRRVFETLRHGSSEGASTARGAELLAIAVALDRQGEGVGGRLVRSFLNEVIRRELDAAHVIVGADNQPAVKLYEKAGFVTADKFELHVGTLSLLMQWDRTPPALDRTGPPR
jgi:ribosomal protein S18 acetylase RimI-like enzyme